MTAEQALQNLYAAARAVSANAEIHEGLRQSYELLADFLRCQNQIAEVK